MVTASLQHLSVMTRHRGSGSLKADVRDSCDTHNPVHNKWEVTRSCTVKQTVTGPSPVSAGAAAVPDRHLGADQGLHEAGTR